MRSLVIVRPEPGASATAEAGRQLGLEPLAMPLFAIRPLDWEPPDPSRFDALLLTSANAVRHGVAGLERLRTLPAYCVGEATAQAARDFGLEVASIGSGRVDSLLESVPGELRLLHLCGFHRREPKAARQAIEVLPVYSAEAVAAPDAFGQIEDCVVALHSPRAAARVSELVDAQGLRRGRIALAAISAEAAEAAGSGWQRVECAAEPSDSALLAIAAELCKNPR
jgi:uroporphyrinogen-III synthase